MSVYNAVMTTTTRSVTATGDVIVSAASMAALVMQSGEAQAERLLYASQNALAADKAQAIDNAQISLDRGMMNIVKARSAIQDELDSNPKLKALFDELKAEHAARA